MRKLKIPREIRQAMDMGAALAVSISGGKDGEAMLNELVPLHIAEGWTGPIFAIHADLGRAEWPQTPAHVERMAARAGVRLVVVNRRQGDLFARFEERAAATAGRDVPWAPSAQNRYCTSHLKSGPIDAHLRTVEVRDARPWAPSAANRYCTSDLKRGPIDGNLRGFQLVVCAMGIRAQESAKRSRDPVVSVRKQITTERLKKLAPSRALREWNGKGRLALNWNPIHGYSVADVWEACGTSLEELTLRRKAYAAGYEKEAFEGWPSHVAYVMGNDRLSCALCMLASLNDLRNGARHVPEAARFLVQMEDRTGFTYRPEGSLREILGDALPDGC